MARLKVKLGNRGGGAVGKISTVVKALNALGGIACILIGVFLARLDFISIEQVPGSDSFLLIQAHWITVGAISLLVSRSAAVTQFWVALLLAWLMLNGWVGGKAVLSWELKFFWVLAFPIVSGLNLLQTHVQDIGNAAEENVEEVETSAAIAEPQIPTDFYPLKSPSPAAALHGVLQIVFLVALQICLLVFFFFYGTLLTRVIFEGANIDFDAIPHVLGGVFWKILYIPIIIAAVYSIVFLIQLVIEKMAIGGGTAKADDANRALSLQERKFIEEHLHEIGEYISDAKFPAFYGWLYWPSIFGMIGFFIGLPAAIVLFEAGFFNPATLAGIPEQNVISSLGPAFVGGAVFGFLFGSTLYWAGFQWLGARYRSVGEYLHMRWGWNSMNAEQRSLAAYAKIFTRFVRKRLYSPERKVSPQQFIHDAYDEFSGFLYKVTVVLGVATVVFTVLDVNWRRIVHTEGFHYSPYLDWRSHDLTFDDVVEVELRCFLYDEGDDGERSPGVGYDLVFSNGMYADLLEPVLSEKLLDKVEAIDADLVVRGIPFGRADRAGRFLLRDIEGYRSDCQEAVLPKLEEKNLRARLGRLLRVESHESAPIN